MVECWWDGTVVREIPACQQSHRSLAQRLAARRGGVFERMTRSRPWAGAWSGIDASCLQCIFEQTTESVRLQKEKAVCTVMRRPV